MCVFCKIVSGEIPSYKIYEDDKVLAFLDISQATIGHTLIIPKAHCENIFSLDEEVAKHLFEKAVMIAKKIKSALNIQALNILNNNGALAGQSVFHYHIHLIPRYENDNLVIKFSQNQLSKDEFNDLTDKLKI